MKGMRFFCAEGFKRERERESGWRREMKRGERRRGADVEKEKDDAAFLLTDCWLKLAK